MATRMQQRRGTAAQWAAADPVLGAGEIGWETDTNKFKIGDGVNNWDDLNYFLDAVALGGSIDDYIPLTQKGVANGVATLNASAKIPAEQLDIDELSQDAVNTALTAGTGITKTYNDNANTITVAVDTATIAPLASPALSGVPTAPTAAAGTNTTQIATTAFVSTAVSNLVDSAPGTLDTLNELAAALADDPSFATTITNSLAGKQDVVSGVSSTEIGYLDGVTSAIQTQLDGKSSTSHTHTLNDLSDVTISSAANNQVIKFNGTAWVNAAAGGGILASDTAPTDTTAYPLWYNTAEGRAYIYYDSFWVELSPSIAGPQGPAGATGPQGPAGATGATGATGPAGVVAATSPITYNSGTQTVGINEDEIQIVADNYIMSLMGAI